MAEDISGETGIFNVAQQFKQMFGLKNNDGKNTYLNSDDSLDDEDYDDYDDYDDYNDEDDDEDSDYSCSEMPSDVIMLHLIKKAHTDARNERLNIHRVFRKKKILNETTVHVLHSDVVEKNAKELVAEEEREKRKAKKRKEKKKRRREKKKGKENENGNAIVNVNESTSSKKESHMHQKNGSSRTNKRHINDSSEDVIDEEEFLDPNSAFVSIAISKNKKSTTSSISTLEKSRNGGGRKIFSDNEDVIVAESERLAMAGYNMASREQYEQAVEYFTRAIRLIHNDHRFFGNRSFCYCQLGHFSKALKDADKAIGIAPQNPKGYYRRGEALHGLKQYKEAEKAFEKVLQLDKECDDAQQELENCRVFQLVEMGFPEKQCRASIKQFHTVQAAIDGLTSSCHLSMNNSDIFYSDEELDNNYPEFESTTQHASSGLKDIKMDPSNPEGHTSLWVGNVTQKVTEKQLTALFNKYGPLLNIRLLSEKFCAFVNYRTKTAPGLAMKHLQGKEIGGDHLLIRFPNNPVAEGYQQILVKKKEIKSAPVVSTSCSKLSGPVNGNECHFWRTTGCAFSDKCRYKHVKENKGIDKKPWHKSS